MNIDPFMGSGHILVYEFDVLMQIYGSCGYIQRDAAKSILENARRQRPRHVVRPIKI
ncbi:MAG: hypothetical protein ACRKFN_04635 [Desulfitobacterium sp.]